MLAGHVTDRTETGFRLTRWVPDCCGQDRRPVHVDCEGPPVVPSLGRSVKVVGSWVDGTGRPGAGPPALAVQRLETLAQPLPRSEHAPAELAARPR